MNTLSVIKKMFLYMIFIMQKKTLIIRVQNTLAASQRIKWV